MHFLAVYLLQTDIFVIFVIIFVIIWGSKMGQNFIVWGATPPPRGAVIGYQPHQIEKIKYETH